MPKSNCVFCDRVDNGQFDIQWLDAVSFEPLNPVVPGHKLVVPRIHVENFTDYPRVTAGAMEAAAILARGMGDCNLITSKGAAATQTIKHLHIHLVPRRAGDGLHLPWTGQK